MINHQDTKTQRRRGKRPKLNRSKQREQRPGVERMINHRERKGRRAGGKRPEMTKCN